MRWPKLLIGSQGRGPAPPGRVESDGHARGDNARDRGDWAEAVEEYKSYLSLEKEDFAIWVQYGHALKECGLYEDAQRAYGRAAVLNGSDPDLLLNQGHLSHIMGMYSQSFDYYKASYELDGNWPAVEMLSSPNVMNVSSESRIYWQVAVSFNKDYYLSQNEYLNGCSFKGIIDHYLSKGELGGYKPNEYFDPLFFSASAGLPLTENQPSLLRQYISSPELYDLSPSSIFDGNSYLNLNEDVRRASINPMAHYLAFGKIQPWRIRSTRVIPSSANVYLMAFRKKIIISDDVLLFSAFAPSGHLSTFQRDLLQCYSDAGYCVVLCLNVDRFDQRVDLVGAAADLILVRQNVGFDFGAWAHACLLIDGLSSVSSVSFANDSVAVVGGAAHLRKQRALVKSSGLDVAFATGSREIREHFQSYFFVMTTPALRRGGLKIVAETPAYSDKDELIHKVEVHLADKLSALGLKCGPLYSVAETDLSVHNPTIKHFDALLDVSPFFKVQLMTMGLLRADDARIQARLGERLIREIVTHVRQRNGTV